MLMIASGYLWSRTCFAEAAQLHAQLQILLPQILILLNQLLILIQHPLSSVAH